MNPLLSPPRTYYFQALLRGGADLKEGVRLILLSKMRQREQDFFRVDLRLQGF